LTLGFFKLRTM